MQNPQIVLIIFTAFTSVGVLIQAFVLLGMFIALRKATNKVHDLSDQLKQHLIPALSHSRNLLEDISPKIKVATSNLVVASEVIRTQAEHLNKTMSHVTDVAETQVTRVDEMATAVLDGLTQATAAVQHGISTPLKQVSGVLNGLRAGLEVLRKKETPAHVGNDGINVL
ncbi:hypothetical protein [Acidobacterium sp. S8]|uniref:hypothetical protein n=1 Tax=Acidobacterium sp. S8 TaxID=1641854 RepID=UPI00131D7A48|nr:hypothetical protein [Acidobacterium sp. S8]